MIAAESFETVGVFDVNKDSHLDIVLGYYQYKGLTFKDRVYTGEVKRFGEYWDSFSVLPMDANNDGWTDFIYGGCQKFVKNIIRCLVVGTRVVIAIAVSGGIAGTGSKTRTGKRT